MKNLFLFAAAACALVMCGCQSAKKGTQARDLVLNAYSRYQIVIPDRHANPGTSKLVRQTAELLRQAFKETIGADFPVVRESQRSSALKSIYLGNTRQLRAHRINPLRLFKDYNFGIREFNGNIYIAGADRHRFYSTKAVQNHLNYMIGSARGAICFMEKFLDVRFLYPGAVGTDFVKKDKIVIPRNYEYKGVPTLKHMPGRNYDFFYDYANSNCGPGTLRSHGGHSYYGSVPAEKYGKTNPEYFALQGSGSGKKRVTSGNHLCISNKEVQKLIYQYLLKSLDEGAEIAELAQTDAYQPCQCDECAKLFGVKEHSEKLWILHRKMAEQLMKDRPGKKVMIIAYNPTQDPPKTFDSFPENTMIELCKYSPADFKKWSRIKVPQGFLVYIYNWGWYNMPGATPKRTPDFVANQARLFIANKVKGVYRCGFGENFGMEGPAYYVFGKILEDPKRSEDQLLDEFYRRAFKESAAPMRVFYETLYPRVELYSRLAGDGFEGNPNYNPPIPRNPRILVSSIYTAEVLDVMEKQLDRAEKMAKDPKVRKRLELVRKEFDYTKNLGEVLSFYSAFRLFPNKANLDVLLNAIEKRNKMIDSYYDAKGRMKTIPGWPEIPVFGRISKSILMTNGRLRAPIDAPLTWNVKLLREKKIIPGTAKSRMTIKKVKGAVDAQDFNKGAWSNAEWHKLNGIQLGEVSEQTRFKALYDEKNVYFAIETEVPDSRKHKTFGVDGPAWREDALELVLDPSGNRLNYYHFICNPVPNSCYDSAVGFIEDVLDPRYNKADVSWNSKWTYTTLRKNNKWYCLITIPFADMKVKPASGAMWTMNLGREIHIPVGHGRSSDTERELALWAPSLESLSFHDKDSFGEAVFE